MKLVRFEYEGRAQPGVLTDGGYRHHMEKIRARLSKARSRAIRRLKALDPQARAIVSSGYSYDPVMASFQEFGFSGVIPKPYVMEELGRVLEEVIGKKTAATVKSA